MSKEYSVIIIGGGLAGLCAGIHLQRAGVQTLVMERYAYPKHKVCGEYLSLEVEPYLNSLGVRVRDLTSVQIERLEFSNQQGKTLTTSLPLGALGISRYALDEALAKRYQECGGALVQQQVTAVHYLQSTFEVWTAQHSYRAKWVFGAYGKRSLLDKQLSRNFIRKQTPWLAVKAHYQGAWPAELVGLHHFKGGYCGLSQVENGRINVCYLTHLDSFDLYKNLRDFEEDVLSENSALDAFFKSHTIDFEERLTISQISFEAKEAVVDHVWMLGDAAGLIHPLCGNGMAMAIHSAKIAAELWLEHARTSSVQRESLEKQYTRHWNRQFRTRLRTGRWLQRLLLHESLASVSVDLVRRSPSLLNRLIAATHGTSL
ncbi:NAD(P)/FAD-dependent oxidoreductase [Croceiramulus getboli]|nr:FAD-dependent monooxygenase [Flavobacteriaceae bacterium YJPT1-3]